MAQETQGTRQCPYCKEEIRADAIKCKHCKSSIPPDKPEHGGTCPFCKEEVRPDAVKCKHCGSFIGPKPVTGGCGCGCDKPGSIMRGRPIRGAPGRAKRAGVIEHWGPDERLIGTVCGPCVDGVKECCEIWFYWGNKFDYNHITVRCYSVECRDEEDDRWGGFGPVSI